MVNDVVRSIRQRAREGKQKYGVTLDREDLSLLDWLRHLREELQDAALYARKLEREHES